MDLKELRGDDVDWIHLAQDRDQRSCEHGNGSSIIIKGGEFLE
jgi:hypothetical protein